MYNISDRLLEERKRLGLNQDKMAEKGGVAKRTYCNYESGERKPIGSFFTAIAAAGADVNYILTGTRKETQVLLDALQGATQLIVEKPADVQQLLYGLKTRDNVMVAEALNHLSIIQPSELTFILNYLNCDEENKRAVERIVAELAKLK